MTSFVLLNKCSDAALTADVLAAIAAAIDTQLNRDFSPIHGGNYRVRAATPDNPPADGEVVALILDDLPNAPGAVAYHAWEGHPTIYEARNMCSSLTDGEGSLSQALSHELCEEIGDPAVNLWADDMTGMSWAYEFSDAVEAGWYAIGGTIAVSDYLYPAFFEPGALGPYSQVQAMGGAGPAAPFANAPGGYQDQRPTGGGEVQVFGSIRPHKLAQKRHWSSRTYRRGARV